MPTLRRAVRNFSQRHEEENLRDMSLTVRQVAENLNIREFVRVCGVLDKHNRPNIKFAVESITRREQQVTVIVDIGDRTLKCVKLKQKFKRGLKLAA
jgi:hypothetical protein